MIATVTLFGIYFQTFKFWAVSGFKLQQDAIIAYVSFNIIGTLLSCTPSKDMPTPFLFCKSCVSFIGLGPWVLLLYGAFEGKF
jgi:hypothetical protein